ncbi:MAG: hypothetical protein A2041_00990 [Bacteroidetes bacterium GWA2_31_9b]|nr:MAG: hypothetical protein A2041_00990 [Bacteroidetes bacterium GWA2_31_9b]
MELIDKLRDEVSSGHVAYTEFVLKQKKKKDCIFCFFEGKDDKKYYGIRINNYTQRNYEPIVCGGKENVIDVRRLIAKKKEYKKTEICYFIDQDYDAHIYIKSIYCLPTYSIENQYANKNVLKKLLTDEFSLNEENEDFSIALNLFERLQNKFHKETLYLNAWLSCQNDKRKKLGLKTNLKIDSLISSYFSSIASEDLSTISNFTELNNLSSLQSIFSDAPLVKASELKTKLKLFEKQNPEILFRGKFQLKFFISFLHRLQSDICKKNSVLFKEKHKCSFRFEFATALTSLSIYAETPECLYNYLKPFKQNVA